MPKSSVNNCSQLVRILLSAPARFCSRTIRNFVLGPYAILLSDRTQFCSWTVLNFALGPYAILLSDRCSYSFSLSNRCSYPRPTGPPYLQCQLPPPQKICHKGLKNQVDGIYVDICKSCLHHTELLDTPITRKKRVLESHRRHFRPKGMRLVFSNNQFVQEN